MVRALAVAVAVGSLALLGGTAVQADPITYKFAGTFDQPMNGIREFSGTFTFNLDPTADNIGVMYLPAPDANTGRTTLDPGGFYPGTHDNAFGIGPVGEVGKDVDLTVTMGGQTFHYANTPDHPLQATFQALYMSYPQGRAATAFPPSDFVSIQGVSDHFNPGFSDTNDSFGLTFATPTDTIFHDLAAGQVANLRAFPIDMTTLHGVGGMDSHGVSYSDQDDWGRAHLDTLEVVPTPEPSSFAIFAALGVAGWVGRARSRRRAGSDVTG